jgi:hypothetical protein
VFLVALSDPLTLDALAIRQALDPQAPLFPELEAARANPGALHNPPQLREFLRYSGRVIDQVGSIPQTNFTAYRRFLRDGDRKEYEKPYFEKRAHMAFAALRLFLGIDTHLPLKDSVQNYLWNICEESTWVLPAHERCRIDLFAAETGFMLADTLNLLGEALDAEVRSRVRDEVERRIFDPYLRFHHMESWYLGGSNWNGVCNSSVAAAFALLEPEQGRVAQALAIAFRGLRHFLDVAFEADGGSNEGVSYWHYGLFNLVALAELLRARTRGAIDLLDSERVRRIAAYPAKLQLSGSAYAAFSDCDETLTFHPGFLARLRERTGEESLRNLLAQTREPSETREHWRLTMMLRSLLWWDGERPAQAEVGDSTLPACGVARMAGRAADGAALVAAIKAGHNAENHNQNDIGSFLVHVDGENLLTDPGRGLYSRFYFGPQRYENIFANSYGHSVPRVAGQLQPPGREYQGQLLGLSHDGERVSAAVEIAGAYPASSLKSLRRELAIAGDGQLALTDTFRFDGPPVAVEEAFVTWGAVNTEGAQASIQGERHALKLTIVEPAGAAFAAERLEEQCRANQKPGVLTRLSVALPEGAERFALRIEVQQ